jgi:hypothetical protein
MEVEMMNASIIRILCTGVVVSWLCMAYEPIQVHAVDGGRKAGSMDIKTAYRGTFIAEAGDITSILGPQGKSIAVSANGEAVAVIYGGVTTDPINYMDVRIAYSTDFGENWCLHGSLSPYLRRIYPGVDGSPHFDTNPGELYFAWQESPSGYTTGALMVAVEENVPAAPSFSSPGILPHSDSLYPWFPSIAVSPDDPYRVIVTAWSYLNYGNLGIYCWVTTEGGYTWSDSIRMIDAIDQSGGPGHIRWGSGEYIFYNYLDAYDWHGTSIIYPHFVESTDGGWTWTQPEVMPEVPLMDPVNTQFSRIELDCEVINNEPWAVLHDLNWVTPASAGFWIFHATGSPGNWTWEIFDINELGACSTWVSDTMLYCSPVQYPSVAYDPVSNTILIAYLADFLKTCGTDTLYAGPHIGGVYTQDNGATWTVCTPLCETHINEISWENWNATEVAHRLVNISGSIYSYAVCLHYLDIYFERGLVKPFLPTGIEEQTCKNAYAQMYAVPTIFRDKCAVRFSLNAPARAVLDLYDAAGRFVHNVFDGYCKAGTHEFEIRLSDMPAGIYFVRINAGEQTHMTKIIVAR